MKKFFTLFLLLGSLCLQAQVMVFSPAKPQSQAIVIQNATIHVGNGQIVNGSVRFENGKITAVGASVSTEGAELINAQGKHLYPSLILTNTALGLNEIESIRSMADDSEVGAYNPHIRALVGYNTDSELIPTTRANGILIAQAAPQGEGIAGTSAIMQLDGWNWEDAVLKADDGIHVNWPVMFRRPFWLDGGDATQNDQRMNTIKEMDKFFEDAYSYSQSTPQKINLRFEAMKGLYDGSKKLFIRTNEAKTIIESVQYAQKWKIKNIVIIGGNDSWLVTDFLKAHKIPVILDKAFSLPARPDEDVDLPFRLPYLLKQAGVEFAMTYTEPNHSLRNLPFSAGMACGYGLSKEEALQMVTLSVAKILGIDKMVGSIEVGKDATLVVSDGDLLDMRTNNVTHAFIQGKKLDLRSKHTELYQKYKNKYEGK